MFFFTMCLELSDPMNIYIEAAAHGCGVQNCSWLRCGVLGRFQAPESRRQLHLREVGGCDPLADGHSAEAVHMDVN